MSQPCIKEEIIGTLLEGKKNFEEFMWEIKNNHLKSIYEKLNIISEKMSNRRPTWTMAWIIAILGSLCTTLLTIILKK